MPTCFSSSEKKNKKKETCCSSSFGKLVSILPKISLRTQSETELTGLLPVHNVAELLTFQAISEYLMKLNMNWKERIFVFMK